MDINDFFEWNSVSLEVMQTYSEYCLSMGMKTALNVVHSELREEFAYEDDQKVLFFMALYWCGLQNGFVDEKSRKHLDKLTRENVFEIFGHDDGETVYEVLKQLLELQPIKLEKKIKSSNSGAYNWRSGDIYAYLMDENDVKNISDKSLEGKYVLIYCIENEITSKKKSRITCYVLLKNDIESINTFDDIMSSARFLPHTQRYKNAFFYRYVLISSNAEYPPPERLIFLGNFLPMVSPLDEEVPRDVYNRRLLWRDLGEDIERTLKKFFEK